MNLLYITWNPDVVALDLGFFQIRWYSLLWCIGLMSVYWLMHRLYRQQNIPEEKFEPMFAYCFVGILVGARLGHCLLYEPAYFLSHPIEMFLPIRQMADGSWRFTGYEGLASHGGTTGLILSLWLFARHTRQKLMVVVDNVAIVTPVCACAIRLGNLMNSEIIGSPTTMPWGFIFKHVDDVPRHPGQLYEAICYAIFFLVTWWFYRQSMTSGKSSAKRTYQVGSGFYFGMCIFMIFTARFFIELVKENQEAFESDMLINMGQLLSLPFIALGAYFIRRALRNSTSR